MNFTRDEIDAELIETIGRFSKTICDIKVERDANKRNEMIARRRSIMINLRSAFEAAIQADSYEAAEAAAVKRNSTAAEADDRLARERRGFGAPNQDYGGGRI
jgi:hypothetical protein